MSILGEDEPLSGAEQCPTCKMPRYQYLRLTPGHPTPCPDSFHDDWVARDYPGAHDTGGRKINEPLRDGEDE